MSSLIQKSFFFLLLQSGLLFPEVLMAQSEASPCSCNKTPARFAANANKTPAITEAKHALLKGMVKIPAGTFMMGGDNHQARRDELPKHQVSVSSFWLDQYEVTNAQFTEFVNKTHYITTAETKPDWELLKKQLPPDTPKPDESVLVPASLVFSPPNHPVPLDNFAQWWTWMPGADWRHPHGPDSKIEELKQPVVHVSWDDALAYCRWVGKRLPREAEWEWAARGGLKNKIYPWGNEPIDEGEVKANTWQGEFPYKNTLRDKYYYAAPVGSFAPNAYGLYDMAGNVWEWVADWYHVNYYQTIVSQKVVDPQGPEKSYDPDEPTMPKRVLRGGSYLCNESYCSGYRVAARMKSSPDTSMEHIGFRCAISMSEPKK
ncbi:formylglycine-generating enzyme family protein [Legionella lytica]|uniref:Formylglycine-generating enzyme family protein n=1 Tax=Legionella lytica TaxID=96232 RepID=A0ABW8DAG5_9GAMM